MRVIRSEAVPVVSAVAEAVRDILSVADNVSVEVIDSVALTVAVVTDEALVDAEWTGVREPPVRERVPVRVLELVRDAVYVVVRDCVADFASVVETVPVRCVVPVVENVGLCVADSE